MADPLPPRFVIMDVPYPPLFFTFCDCGMYILQFDKYKWWTYIISHCTKLPVQSNPLYLPSQPIPNHPYSYSPSHSNLPHERYQLLPNTNYCRWEQILLSSNWQTSWICFDDNTISDLNISFNSDSQNISSKMIILIFILFVSLISYFYGLLLNVKII